MKLILENWKKFLKEQSGLGINPEEVECPDVSKKCIQALRDEEFYDPARVSYHMRQAGYTYHGGGAYRKVFNIPDHPDKILKVSFDYLEQAKEMNRKEAEGKYQTSSPLTVKVFDAAKDYMWIISEKVNVIHSWEDLQKFLVEHNDWPFPSSDEYDFHYVFRMLIRPDAPERENDIRNEVIKLLKPTPEGQEKINNKEDETITDSLINKSLFTTIRNFLIQHDLTSEQHIKDIRPENVGYVVRDGIRQFVILDPGFELEKA